MDGFTDHAMTVSSCSSIHSGSGQSFRKSDLARRPSRVFSTRARLGPTISKRSRDFNWSHDYGLSSKPIAIVTETAFLLFEKEPRTGPPEDRPFFAISNLPRHLPHP